MTMFDEGKHSADAAKAELMWHALQGNQKALSELDAGQVELVGQVLQGDKEALSSPNAMEAALVKRALQRDQKALSALYLLNIRIVYAYFYHKVYNQHDTEECTAETFTRAVKMLKEGRYEWVETAPFRSWLLGIAWNVLLEYWRKATEARELAKILPGDSHEPSALDLLVDQENKNDIWKLVGELTQDEQTAIILHFSYKLSHAEIAQVLDRTPAAAKQLHYRALQKLKAKAKSSGLWSTGE